MIKTIIDSKREFVGDELKFLTANGEYTSTNIVIEYISSITLYAQINKAEKEFNLLTDALIEHINKTLSFNIINEIVVREMIGAVQVTEPDSEELNKNIDKSIYKLIIAFRDAITYETCNKFLKYINYMDGEEDNWEEEDLFEIPLYFKELMKICSERKYFEKYLEESDNTSLFDDFL